MGKTTYTIQQRHKAKGIMTWYLRTCRDGKQTFESLHTTKKGEAMQILQNRKMRDLMPNIPGTSDKEIVSMVNEWVDYIDMTLGSGGKTYDAYRSRIRRWSNWCRENGIKTHTEFTSQEAFRFVQELNAELAPKTVGEIVKLVKKCQQWNVETFDLKFTNPFKAIKNPRVKKGRVEFWTSEEIDRIMAHAPSPEFRALWGLMAYAGLRFAEARNLKACDAQNGIIKVVEGKGGKTAELPISSKLDALIRPYLKNDGLLIPKSAVPIRCGSALAYLKIAVELSNVTPGETSHHKLRHSFASELLRKGVNPRTVQELMRHSSIDTLFKHYAHVLRSDLAEAVEKI